MGLSIKYRQPLDTENTIDLYSVKRGFFSSSWNIDDMYSHEIRKTSILNSFGYNIFINPDSDSYYYESQVLDSSFIENFSYIADVYGHVYTYDYFIDESTNKIKIGYDIAGKPLQLIAGSSRVALDFRPINGPTNINKNGLLDFNIFPHTDIVEAFPGVHGPHFILVNDFYLNIYNSIIHNEASTDISIIHSDEGNRYIRAKRISGRFYKIPRYVILDTSTSDIRVVDDYPSSSTYTSYTPIEALHYINHGIIYMNIGSLKPNDIWIKITGIRGRLLKVNINPFILFHGGNRYFIDSLLVGIEKTSRKLVYSFMGERDNFGHNVIYDENSNRIFSSNILWFSNWKFSRTASDYKKIQPLIPRE